MYKIQLENNMVAFQECVALGKQYYEEVESKSSFKPWNPKPEVLDQLMKLDAIKLITVRKGDSNDLVAFMGLLIVEDFMTSEFVSREICLYVKPEYRKTSAFLRLMKAAEEVSEVEGAKTLFMGFKVGHNEHLPEKMGYEPTEIIFQKFLGE